MRWLRRDIRGTPDLRREEGGTRSCGCHCGLGNDPLVFVGWDLWVEGTLVFMCVWCVCVCVCVIFVRL